MSQVFEFLAQDDEDSSNSVDPTTNHHKQGCDRNNLSVVRTVIPVKNDWRSDDYDYDYDQKKDREN